MDNLLPFVSVGLISFTIGGLIAWLVVKSSASASVSDLKIKNVELTKQIEADQDKLKWLESTEAKIREIFESLASRALKDNSTQILSQTREQLDAMYKLMKGDWNTQNQEFKSIVGPIEKDLDRLDKHVRSMEEKREGAYKTLETHIASLTRAHTELNSATVTLTQALKSSSIRGRWGEVQLRRIAELAGMVDHVDFTEQATSETGTGRPDMIVHLPNHGIIPVDSKAPMSSYLDSSEADNEAGRNAKLLEHAKALRGHMKSLAQKAYWSQFETSPEFVVMLIPYESGLSAAFSVDPTLLEDALQSRVIIVSPATLLALLKTVALGWVQLQLAKNAQEIASQGKELHSRFKTFISHFGDIGNKLHSSVQSFNKAAGSFETRVLPSVRRLRELGAGSEDVNSIPQIEIQPRELSGFNGE